MPGTYPVGPYRTISSAGIEIPYFIIPFDKRGVCEAPRTRDELCRRVEEGDFSDVFLFSHGWNNDWEVATHRYESFISGFMGLRGSLGLSTPPGYKPLLVGVFWPSTALVWEDEEAPDMAGISAKTADRTVAEDRRRMAEIASEVADDDLGAFYELAQKETWTAAEAVRFAGMIRRIYGDPSEDDEGAPPEPGEIVEAWRVADLAGAEPEDEDRDLRTDFGGTGEPVTDPDAAGVGDALRGLVPRQVIRLLTVYQMKDRAGKVGFKGVAPLLDRLLQAPSAPHLHLIGHSYGGKVVLSAAAGSESDRKIHSMLLLQPAVNHLCFAARVPGTQSAGGYHRVPGRVRRPLLSTFSNHDFPLTRTFHLALRRKRDLGELRTAGGGVGESPPRFGALGGFGPREAGERLVAIRDPGVPYPELAEDPPPEVVGIDGSRTIMGHGDISNPSTWWALHQLVER